MAKVGYSKSQRKKWHGEVGDAIVEATTEVRERALKALRSAGDGYGTATLFKPAWWDAAIEKRVRPVLVTVARSAGYHMEKELPEEPALAAAAGDDEDQEIEDAIAATLLMLKRRGVTINARIEAVVAQAAEEEWGEDRVAAELSLDSEDGGPLSDAVSSNMGLAASAAVIFAAAAIALRGRPSTKTWNCLFLNSRETHIEADGQTVPADEPFIVGGYEADYPGDPALPDEELVNCNCWVEYDVEDVVDETVTAELATAARWATDISAAETFQANGVCVTIEPTALQKMELAVEGGDPPERLHCTLVYLGETATIDRDVVSTVMAKIAAQCMPMEGVVAGMGYFGDPSSITIALIDSPGLAALRGGIVEAMEKAGVTVDHTHDFQPHITLAGGPVDASEKVGMVLTFDNLRLRYGNEAIAFDLVGVPEAVQAPEVPSETAAPADELEPGTPAPEEAAMPYGVQVDHPECAGTEEGSVAVIDMETGQALSCHIDEAAAAQAAAELNAQAGVPEDQEEPVAAAAAEGVATFEDVVAPEVVPVEEAPVVGEIPPPNPDLASVSAEDLQAELARRAAEEAAAVTGEDPALLEQAAYEEVADAVSDVCEDLVEGDGAEAPMAEVEPQGTSLSSLPTTAGAILEHVLAERATLTASAAAKTFTVIGSADLPLAERDAAWDGDAATARMAERASSDGSGDPATIDWGMFGEGFLYRDDEAPETITGHKLPFADVVNGTLEAIPAGVFGVAAALGGSRGGVDIPEAEQDQIRARVGGYYERMADKFEDPEIVAPWEAAVAEEAQDFLIGEGLDGEAAFEWEGVLTVEGIESGDGRMLGQGALTWRTLPVPLMLQETNLPGHEGSVPCGSIQEIERVGQNIVGRGVFHDGENGEKARAYIEQGTMRGVSVDIDRAVVLFADPETGEEITVDDYLYGGVPAVELLVEGRVMGATICAFPAFQEANINVVASEDVDDALVAAGARGDVWQVATPTTQWVVKGQEPMALVASAGSLLDEVLVAPPSEWFSARPMEEPEPFSVGADGRCYGLIAKFGSCHIGFGNRCVPVPRSSDFAAFYSPDKHVLTSDGQKVAAGPIIMDTVHPNLRMVASDAQAHYAHTGSAIADVALYVNQHGIVAAGAVRPGVDPAALRKFRTSDISPDWRKLGGELKVVALLAVNTSGFIVDALAASAGGTDLAPVLPLTPRGLYDTAADEVVALVAAGAMSRAPRRGVQLSGMTRVMAAEISRLRRDVEELQATERARRAAAALGSIQATTRPALVEAAAAACGCGQSA